MPDTRRPVDLARDDIIDQVEALPANTPDRATATKTALRRIVNTRGVEATVEAAADRVWYHRTSANALRSMADNIERAAINPSCVEQLRSRVEELRQEANQVEQGMLSALAEDRDPFA